MGDKIWERLVIRVAQRLRRSTVAISDDCSTVTIGAFGSDSCGVFSGAAYVYLADTKGVINNAPQVGKLPKLVHSKVVWPGSDSYSLIGRREAYRSLR